MVVIENQFGPTDHTHLGQITDEASRRDQFEWLASKLERFRIAFYDRVRALNIEVGPEDAEGED